MATKCKSYIDAVTTIEFHNEQDDRFYEHDIILVREDWKLVNKVITWIARKLAGPQTKAKDADINIRSMFSSF